MLHWPFLFRVRGDSMHPSLQDGQWVIAFSLNTTLPALGSIVIISDPQHPGRKLIKRVRSHGTNTFSVSSDNPLEGRDSRVFGSIHSKNVVGIARYVWHRGLKLI